MLNSDPLRITYIVVQGDDPLDQMSPFQGFGASWPSTLWALRLLVLVPATFLERYFPLDGLLAQRMGGANGITWFPLRVGALEQLTLDDIGFALVVMTGDETVAARVDAWIAQQPRLVLHVRGGEINSEDEGYVFRDIALREFCRTLLDEHGSSLSAARFSAARIGVEKWLTRKAVEGDSVPGGHNVTLPNEMVLLRADRKLPEVEAFIGRTEKEYDDLAIASAQSVLDVRQANDLRNFNRLWLPQPSLFLTEPALYRNAYNQTWLNPKGATKPMRDALRFFQKQTGLCNTITPEQLRALQEDKGAQAVIASRQRELLTHCLGVGLSAAQTVSAVLRLRPGVNRVFPTLLRYAHNVRAQNSAARAKVTKLFDDIQRELADSVGEARIRFIERHEGGIRIISDAPLELLPIGNLPLGLRFNTSRINATPGNLMMGTLARAVPSMLTVEDLCRVLVVSAFAEDDPLRNVMEDELRLGAAELEGRVTVDFVRVETREEFVTALNASQATILVFDGHGTIGTDDGIGGIMIGREIVDAWQLRAEVRIPPIVVLSACDTHGLDAPSHATVGNGFLACGATSVLATLLPIGGLSGAKFIRRLLLRLAQYLPAVLGQEHRAYSWCEVVTGMLRMTLGSDLIENMVTDKALNVELKVRANLHINLANPDWYEAILDDLASATGVKPSAMALRARSIMSRSEAIRYVHLGMPEAITIVDRGIEAQVFPSDFVR